MKSSKPSKRLQNPNVFALDPHDRAAVQQAFEEIQLAIARRAYELFEARGSEHGHDWEDWFRAEAEMLKPVPFTISEKTESLNVRADLTGFQPSEVKIAVEPTRIVIVGQRQAKADPSGEGKKTADHPDLLLRVIDLSNKIDPRGAVVEFRSGVLSFEAPKVVDRTVQQEQAA